MRRRPPTSHVQMNLPLERFGGHRPAAKAHDEIVSTLADLLLEALRGQTHQEDSGSGDNNESED
jgi:hypothetical protein